MPSDMTIKEYVCGGNNVLAIGSDDKLYSCGYNCSYQQGVESYDSQSVHELKLPNNIKPIHVMAEDRQCIVQGEDGIFYSFGQNSYCKLGRTTETYKDADIVKMDINN